MDTTHRGALGTSRVVTLCCQQSSRGTREQLGGPTPRLKALVTS
jgi:hypothetical protein